MFMLAHILDVSYAEFDAISAVHAVAAEDGSALAAML